MFAKALAQVEQYTLPVLLARRHWNGQISSACGTCMILNSDGWVLTAFHIAQETTLADKHKPEIDALIHDRDAIPSGLPIKLSYGA